MLRRETRWKLVHASAGLVAAWMTRNALDALWRRATESPSPASPERRPPSSEPRKALAWALGSAAAVAMGRVLADEGARRLWAALDGDGPPTG